MSSQFMPGCSAVMRSVLPSSTTSMRGWNQGELQSLNHRSSSPKNGSLSQSFIARHGSVRNRQCRSGHFNSECRRVRSSMVQTLFPDLIYAKI